jgi:hypothetical protein
MNRMHVSNVQIERHALQAVVTAASLVPIAAGASGMLMGPIMLGDRTIGSADLDGHFRYLSGLLLGIGLGYLSAVPGIERHRARFILLGGFVFLGGSGRLLSILSQGAPSPIMIGALVMELLVTPFLTLWQLRVARRSLIGPADKLHRPCPKAHLGERP